MAYKSTAQLNRNVRILWEFTFRNVNKTSKQKGPVQTIIIAVRSIAGNNYRKVDAMKKEAVRKFTDVVSYMYPNADQIVTELTMIKSRVFV